MHVCMTLCALCYDCAKIRYVYMYAGIGLHYALV